jgi:formyl-CoA transferase
MTGPLSGVRVIEVAAYLFVPMAGAVMADLGADVIKVEPRRGEPMHGTKTANTAVQRGDGSDAPPPNLMRDVTCSTSS